MYKNEAYWNDFYSENKELRNASKFCQSNYLSIYNPEDYLVLELGCGNGADSFFFANKGFEVIAVDGSNTAITNNKALSNNFVNFIWENLSDEKAVKNLFSFVNEKAIQDKKKVLIYTRFFLHAIPDEVEDLLFSTIINELKVPFNFVSEFRVKEDKDLYKIYDNHYRRYVDTNKLIKKIIQIGYEIVKFEKSRGLSPYKNEDPFIARFTLQKYEG
ncbi:class I SAM-dependent methyltransferase [Lysinibacillus sp. NPDC094403]|uniref:class I SAM-dependent methyltransferase n=1 Tax=Lysinibacillus sp. NPDC094403 TaxID=3390581 RepID=UPI003D090D10